MKILKKSSPILKTTEPKDIVEAPKYTDLRQVMDYTRDFSMFYSGVEYENYLDGCYDMGVRNFLMSYEYLKAKGASQLKKYSDMHLFIDSGAFTYMNDPKFENYTVEDWEKQIEAYLIWATKHKSSIFALSELDLQYLVGLETVQKWREKYFEPFMLKTGVPVCFIYHNEGLDIWERMCQRYPLVGFSSVADSGEQRDLNDYKGMLKTAEKHNALVHGFGMTKTSMLPELPFYTVDSTSWKSGFRYGLLSIWNGKKVQQFKKEDWNVKVLPVTRAYPDIKFDEEKLWEFYEPEILRASVYAYMRAEKFIIERHRSITYWKKSKTQKRDVNNLPDDFYPPREWFDLDSPNDLKDFATKMNINPEYEYARSVIYDITTLMNWDNEEYTDLREEYSENDYVILKEVHDTFINRITPDWETKVKDLQAFYSECIKGDNDRLLQLGTNFDRMVKERDSYLEEEDEYDYEDLNNYEVKTRIKDSLPLLIGEDTSPEIDELDEEIFRKAEIKPVFDEKGKFVKGQVAVRRPKQVYSKKFPKLACDNCFNAAKCPEYKAGYVCAYSKMFDRFDTRSMSDIITSIQGIVGHNMQRMERAMITETLNGTIDPTVSQLMDTNIRYMSMLKSMYENGSAEVLKQTRVMRSDGSTEETTQITNPQSGGILEKIFGGMSGSKSTDIEEEPKKEQDKKPAYVIEQED